MESERVLLTEKLELAEKMLEHVRQSWENGFQTHVDVVHANIFALEVKLELATFKDERIRLYEQMVALFGVHNEILRKMSGMGRGSPLDLWQSRIEQIDVEIKLAREKEAK